VTLATAATAAGITFRGTRHENVAVRMADGFSWRSGGVGVCTVTRGAGLLNAALAIRTAARVSDESSSSQARCQLIGDLDWDFKAIDHGPLGSRSAPWSRVLTCQRSCSSATVHEHDARRHRDGCAPLSSVDHHRNE
jgi:hypothetical protein